MADKVKCVFVRDTWDEDGNRHRAGSEIELEIDAAMDGVESGAVTRAKTAPKKAK